MFQIKLENQTIMYVPDLDLAVEIFIDVFDFEFFYEHSPFEKVVSSKEGLNLRFIQKDNDISTLGQHIDNFSIITEDILKIDQKKMKYNINIEIDENLSRVLPFEQVYRCILPWGTSFKLIIINEKNGIKH